MLLTSVQVKNYKCILDSGEFSTDRVTCLVGKNESGKTAILQALYKLRPIADEDGNFGELEYPRTRWADYTARQDGRVDRAVRTDWAPEEQDLELLHELLGPKALRSNTVTIEKGYDNKTYLTLDIDEQQVVAYLLEAESVSKAESPQWHKAKNVTELMNRAKVTDPLTEQQKSLLARLTSKFSRGTALRAAIDVLYPHMPKFVYFDDYYKLSGQVAIEDLNSRLAEGRLERGDNVFLALLDLAGTSAEAIQSIGVFEQLIARLEAVSNRISRQIFEYWTQNQHLKVDFRFDAARPEDPPPFNSGHVFRTRIEDTRHGVSVPFQERSAGFVWFFSFLVWFSQARKKYGEKVIILLDEPGLNLHARAQADLLRYINERLAPFHQVIYTTHSPFMVDVENLMAVKTVEDVTGPGDKILGTQVGDKVLSTDADTVFPLQAALGYDITQSLFVGKHTLLMEGPSDLLYLKWFSGELRSRGRASLDRRWVLTPSGGIDKVASFLALFGGNRLHVAVLTDFHEGDKRKVRELKESKLLKQGHVLTADMYAGQSEADIEDVMGRPFYIAIVNHCYSLKKAHAVPLTPPAGAPARVVKEVESHFATLPPSVEEFDHYAPAVHLLEHGQTLKATLPGLEDALDRFERLFKDVNAVLPASRERAR